MTLPPLRNFAPLAALALFLLALWALHAQLADYQYEDMVGYLDELPALNLLGAGVLTVLSYAVITAYDLLAMRYIRRPLATYRVMFASFLSYAFSNTIGLSVFASGTLRLRLYSGWGLSALEIARVVLFSTLTLWLGLLVAAGGVLIAKPVDLPELLHVPLPHGRTLGVLLLLPVAGYLLAARLRRQPFRLGPWELPVVRTRLAWRQVVVGATDWVLAAAVLYVLLPKAEELGFLHILTVFLMAQIAALISHVPGGLGVFEAVVLSTLEPWLEAADLLGGLLAFRVIYYLLPLLLATLALGLYEATRLRARLGGFGALVAPLVPALLPPLLALMSAVCGAVLLFSVVSPAAEGRLDWLAHVIPLSLLELSHFAGSVIGMGLLLLAQSLQRRLDAAWVVTVLLLGAGSVSALLKGADYEEALLLALLLLALLPCRRHFYRKASLFEERFTPGWLAAVAMVTAAAVWLGFFSYKEVDYSRELWWQFTFDDDGEAPRFLRALVGVAAVFAALALARLLRPAQPMTGTDRATLEALRPRVAACPLTYAHLALLGDKSVLLSQQGDGFLMYGVQGRSWVAMGDPIGTAAERRELAWAFRERVEAHAGWPVFYQVSPVNLDLYLELGLTLLKIGEEARVELARFTLDGKARANLRNIRSKLERDGYTFRIAPAAEVPALLPALAQVSSAWLAAKNTGEKGFSLGRFDPDYLAGGPLALVERDGALVAFANLWCGADHHELSIDLMRQVPGAPNGTMDFLFVHLLLWGRAQGYAWFNLGMAPLAGLHSRALAPLWNRFGALVFGRGERFYNFKGVRQYKDKFGPVWEARYLAVPGGLRLPHILANLTTLIAGSVQGVVKK